MTNSYKKESPLAGFSGFGGGAQGLPMTGGSVVGQAEFTTDGTETDDREKIRAITEKSDNAIIVASFGTFSTGINIRNLHNIVFSSPSKSPIRVLQSIGRGLRVGDNKDSATVYDISDDLTYKDKKNFTLTHFQERIELYNREGFNYEIHTVDLK